MRAIRARYDPMEQARGRVDQLRQLGHSVDKVEYIIMGGTFMSLPVDYREGFIASLHNALSGYATENVDEAVLLAEQSQTKCVGITIETRPDYCLDQHLSDMLRLGAHVWRLECKAYTKMSHGIQIEDIQSKQYARVSAWQRMRDSRLSPT